MDLTCVFFTLQKFRHLPTLKKRGKKYQKSVGKNSSNKYDSLGWFIEIETLRDPFPTLCLGIGKSGFYQHFINRGKASFNRR